jgi:hypothetical protein
MTKIDWTDMNSPDPSKHDGIPGQNGGGYPPMDFDWTKFVPPMPPLNPPEAPEAPAAL